MKNFIYFIFNRSAYPRFPVQKLVPRPELDHQPFSNEVPDVIVLQEFGPGMCYQLLPLDGLRGLDALHRGYIASEEIYLNSGCLSVSLALDRHRYPQLHFTPQPKQESATQTCRPWTARRQHPCVARQQRCPLRSRPSTWSSQQFLCLLSRNGSLAASLQIDRIGFRRTFSFFA